MRDWSGVYLHDAGRRSIPHVLAGKIPFEQSCIYAFAGWANDCERKLLGLHCGQMLERSRHMAWARKIIGAE